MAEENILIRIRAIDEATHTIKQVSGSLQQLSAPMKQMTTNMGSVQRTIIRTYKPAVAGFNSMEEATSAAGISMKTFDKFARQNFLTVQQGGIVMDRLTGETMGYGKAAKNASIQSRRFKFEWLSIMFAGMALSRAFGGIVRSQMELFGISGLLSDMWTITMLPIMEKISPIIYEMIEAFMELPEPVQEAIGGFILFAGAIGAAAMIIGQIKLAAMGVKLLGVASNAGTAATKVSGLKDGLSKLSSKIGTVAKIAATGILLKLAYDDLAAGKVIAAIGDTLIAAGIWMGKKGIWVMSVGVVLKIAGDEELMISLVKIMYKIGNLITSTFKEAFLAAMSFREFRFENIEGFANVGRAFKIAAEELSLEDVTIKAVFPTESIKKIREEQEKLTTEFEAGIITGKEYARLFDEAQTNIKNLEKQYSLAVSQNEEWRKSVEDISTEWGNVPKIVQTDYIINIRKSGFGGVLAGLFEPKTDNSWTEPTSPKTTPSETTNQTINITPTYNVSSPDPTFVEKLIKAREISLIGEIKRRIGL